MAEANRVASAHAELHQTHLHFLVGYGAKKVSELITKIVALQKTLSKRSGELDSLEVSLLRLVIEEEANVAFAEKVFLYYDTTKKDETEIILFGVHLVKEANELLAGGKVSPVDSRYLKEDIANVEKRVKELRANSNKRYPYVEIPLITYERSLSSMIDRLKQ